MKAESSHREGHSTVQAVSGSGDKVVEENSPTATTGAALDPVVSLRPALDLSQETIDRGAKALFTLWLKIGATVLVAWLLVLIWPVLVLLVLSLMLVATLNPLVRRLQKRFTRGRAISLVVMGIIASGAGLLIITIPPLLRQARQLLTNLPQYLGQFEQVARQAGIRIRLDAARFDLSQQAERLGPEAWNILYTIFNSITGVVTVAVLTTYLLIEGQSVASGALSLLPRHQRLLVRQMFAEIGTQVGEYMRGQFITSGVAAAFTCILMLLLGLPEPLAFGFWMAVADAIPMVGPLVGTLPVILIALTKGTTPALIVVVAMVLYHQFESSILVPRIYGSTMKLSSTIIIIAILIGATLMGILGALLALPVAAAVPVVYRYVQEWRQRDEVIENGHERVLP